MSFKGRGWTAYFQGWIKGLSPFFSWLKPVTLVSERTGNNGMRDQQCFFFTPVKHCDVEQWFSLLVTHWNHVRVFQNPRVQAPPQTIFYQTLSRWDLGIGIFENDPGDSQTAKFETKWFRSKSRCLGITRLGSSLNQLAFPEFPGRATGWGLEGSGMSGTEVLGLVPLVPHREGRLSE